MLLNPGLVQTHACRLTALCREHQLQRMFTINIYRMSTLQKSFHDTKAAQFLKDNINFSFRDIALCFVVKNIRVWVCIPRPFHFNFNLSNHSRNIIDIKGQSRCLNGLRKRIRNNKPYRY